MLAAESSLLARGETETDEAGDDRESEEPSFFLLEDADEAEVVEDENRELRNVTSDLTFVVIAAVSRCCVSVSTSSLAQRVSPNDTNAGALPAATVAVG